ncbi:MAG: penicillin-binding protein 1C [Hyphomicrobium sp.]
MLLPAVGYGFYRKALGEIGPLWLKDTEELSVAVIDRDGKLLRPFTTSDGRWRLPLEQGDTDPRYLKMLFAFEDRRFYAHGGIDARAVLRASLQMVRHGRLVSGASTLTMQVARLVEGKHERTGFGKLRQMARARQLEQALSKAEILRLYLRLAPFGGNIEGVRAASLAYFGKEPKRLSIGEAALLVALPQSPEMRRPDRHPQAARRARDRVLTTAVAAGVISPAEAAKANDEHVPLARLEFPKLAPHLAETEVAANPAANVHKLTLNRDLQAALETLAGKHTGMLGEKLSAAILVADHTTGEILAHVGSAGYLASDRKGAIDMVTAIRSPGSTLKPFIYGLGFEAGLAHPETLIEDRPVRFGSYAPKNFDEDYHGTISIREALSKSLNIPAVRMLARVGPGKLTGRFRRAGIDARFPDKSEPTLAMALGGTGLSLHDLTQLYSGLARGGDSITLTHRYGERIKVLAQTRVKPLANAHRLMTPAAAWYVSDILKDAPPPADAKGGRFAYKTGTSYGYRDALAIGYDGRHVVAVWVGRADGSSVPGLMGRTAAAPILFDAFARISDKRVPLPAPPPGALQVAAADLPPPLKRWREPGDDAAAGPYLQQPLMISFPPDRSEIETADLDESALVLKAEGGALPLTWLIDGAPIPSDPHGREAAWLPAGTGFAKLTVIDADGRVDRAAIRVK